MTEQELIELLRRMSPRLDMLDCENVLTAADRIEALTDKLTAAIKLAELISKYAGMGMNPSTDLQHMASDLLAILKGDTP